MIRFKICSSQNSFVQNSHFKKDHKKVVVKEVREAKLWKELFFNWGVSQPLHQTAKLVCAGRLSNGTWQAFVLQQNEV